MRINEATGATDVPDRADGTYKAGADFRFPIPRMEPDLKGDKKRMPRQKRVPVQEEIMSVNWLTSNQ